MNDQKTIKVDITKNGDVYSAVASTSRIDRQREIVDPRGIVNLNDYLTRNPVVLWSHQWWTAPIGKAVAGRVTDTEVQLDIMFADTDLGKEIKYLYDNGFLNTFSIGFIPLETRTQIINGEEILTYVKWELLELSAVPIPANPDANILREIEERELDLVTVKSLLQKDAQSRTSNKDEHDDSTPNWKRAILLRDKEHTRSKLWIKK